MKKVLFISIIMSLLLVFCTKTANACLYRSLDVDQELNQDHRILVYGTVRSVISSQRAIVEVKENYSKNTVNKYITITHDFDLEPCGTFDFHNYKGDEVLIQGELREDGTSLEVNPGTMRVVYDGTMGVKLDGERQEVTIPELNNYVSEYYGNQSYGGINNNFLLGAIFMPLLPVVVAVSIIIILVVAIIKVRRKNYKYSEHMNSPWE